MAALGFAQCIHGTAMGVQKEGVYQCRQNISEDSANLFAADSDATDSYGSFSFKCKIHSGTVQALFMIDKANRAKFAELLAKEIYPRIIFKKDKNPDNFVALDSITFGEMRVWEYGFTFNANDSYFLNFAKTGAMSLTIGGVYKDSVNLNVGLEEIVEFRKQCMPTPERSKSK